MKFHRKAIQYIRGYYVRKKSVMNTNQSFTKDDNYQDGNPYDIIMREIYGIVPWDCQRREEGRVRRFHVLRTSTEVITICLGRLRKVIRFTMHTAAARRALPSRKKIQPGKPRQRAVYRMQEGSMLKWTSNIQTQETSSDVRRWSTTAQYYWIDFCRTVTDTLCNEWHFSPSRGRD